MELGLELHSRLRTSRKRFSNKSRAPTSKSIITHIRALQEICWVSLNLPGFRIVSLLGFLASGSEFAHTANLEADFSPRRKHDVIFRVLEKHGFGDVGSRVLSLEPPENMYNVEGAGFKSPWMMGTF